MITGIFKYECKNRFIAIVDIDGVETECYMSTSAKIKNFINLTDKMVFLTPNLKKNARTKYTVHSTIIDGNYILLNLNYINKLFFSDILEYSSSYAPEKKVSNNLKVDFLCDEKKELIEIKGILSENNIVKFPHHTSERIIRQMHEFKKEKYFIRLILVLMNPNIKIIELDKDNKEFYKLYKSLAKKLEIEIYTYLFQNNRECLIKNKYNIKKNIINIEF